MLNIGGVNMGIWDWPTSQSTRVKTPALGWHYLNGDTHQDKLKYPHFKAIEIDDKSIRKCNWDERMFLFYYILFIYFLKRPFERDFCTVASLDWTGVIDPTGRTRGLFNQTTRP